MATQTLSECAKCAEGFETPSGRRGRPPTHCPACAPRRTPHRPSSCNVCGAYVEQQAGRGRPRTRCADCRAGMKSVAKVAASAALAAARTGRICAQCGETFQAAPTGVHRFCSASCRHAAERGRRVPVLLTKVCSDCERPFAAAGRSARARRCPRCRERREVARQHVKSLARRGLVQSSLERIGRDEIADRDGGLCALCGDLVDPSLRYPDPFSGSLDHRVPIAAGGQHSRDNLQLAHLACNLSKGAGRHGQANRTAS